jgi:hypothetical protein
MLFSLVAIASSASPLLDDLSPLHAGADWGELALVPRTDPSPGALPTVTAHGMGDSCFNGGMKQITSLIGKTLGTYAVCVPTGNRLTDTTNGSHLPVLLRPLTPYPLQVPFAHMCTFRLMCVAQASS